MGAMKRRTVLISVTAKQNPDIADFVWQLQEIGSWSIISSGGTCKYLRDAGFEVTDIADVIAGSVVQQFISAGVHFVPIESDGPLKLLPPNRVAEMIKAKPLLGHRVVTLAREKSAMLLARFVSEDEAELKPLGLSHIDMVVCDFYALKKAIEAVGATTETVIEATDIGGPTMVSEGAKGRRIVICDPADRQLVIDEMKTNDGDVTEQTRNDLCAKADGVVSRYRLESARFHGKGAWDGMIGHRVQECAYGENGYQTPAGLYSTDTGDPLALDRFKLVEGSPPSLNNWCDIDRLLQTITHAAATSEVNYDGVPNMAFGVKHGNCCGGAWAANASFAIQNMVVGDPRAIFGGLVMVNFKVDEAIANSLLYHQSNGAKRLFDGVIAPEFTDAAVDLLARKRTEKCRILINPALYELGKESLDVAVRRRYVRGGFLAQPNYTFVLDLAHRDLVVYGEHDDDMDEDIMLAWTIGSTSNSNTITLVRNGQLIGNGVGQQDRVGAAELAIKRARDAGHTTAGAVAYSDSFFPFVDGPAALIAAGVRAIFSTSGSKADKDVQAVCAAAGVTLYQLPDKSARGFFGH